MKRPWIHSLFVSTIALLVASPALAQTARGSGQIVNSEPIPGLRGFSVVLVQGDLQAGAPSADGVPAVAAKALADLKDFLPYKNYRLLDTQWTAGAGRMTGRLRGPGAKEYEVELQARRGANDAPLTISRFLLREVGGALADRVRPLVRGGLVAPSQRAQPQGGEGRGGRATASRGTFVMPRSMFEASSSVIDTSFNIDIGETVVVGTSRLQGDTALIVLLTAVSRSQGSARGGR